MSLFQDKTESEYNSLKKIHSECFDISELNETKHQLNELTIKYREVLLNKTNTVSVVSIASVCHICDEEGGANCPPIFYTNLQFFLD